MLQSLNNKAKMKERDTVILTGHRKSGTSVFHRLFDGHEEICLYPVDISILYAYFPCFTQNQKLSTEKLKERLNLVIQKSLENISSYLEEKAINLDDFINLIYQNLENKDIRNKKTVIKAIQESWIQINNCSDTLFPFIFKETSQSIFFLRLKQEIPNLKMISIIRDPRDNYAALKAGVKKYYSSLGEDEKATLASLINRVKMDLKSAQLNQKLYPESFLPIKFEELAYNTEKTMQQVADFLNISFSPTMLNPTFMNQEYEGNSYEGKKFSGVSQENVGRWQQRISQEEGMVIEYWLEEVMNTWKYPLEYTYSDSQKIFADFYEWYNCNYFYHDSFQ